MKMASLEMTSRDHNKKEKNRKVFVRDRFSSCRAFPVDDFGRNEDGKSKEVLECSSRSSVPKTGESLQVPSSYHNSTSSPPETNSYPFTNPLQLKKYSKNDVIMGASSLVQIWEARSQQSSSTLSQSLIVGRTSSGLSLSGVSNLSSFSEFLSVQVRKNNESSAAEFDWCSHLDMSYVSYSDEKERQGRCFLELATCTPRIRGREAYEDVCKMILRDRENELEWLVDCYAVSKSPRRCWRLKYMLRIRSLERCIVIQERYRPKLAASYVNGSSQRSSVMNLRDRYKTNTKKGYAGNVNSVAETRNPSGPVSSRVNKVCRMAKKTGAKNVLQETLEKGNQMETQDATYKPENTTKPNEAACSKNGLKKPEIERKATKEGEVFKKTMEKIIMKESEETNKFSVTIAEMVKLWDSKERTSETKNTEKAKNEEKAARRVTEIETVERNKERRKIKEVRSFEESKSMEIKENRINPQEVTSEICLDKTKDEENGKKSSEDNEETLNAAKQEASETLCLILKSTRLLDDWDEKEMEDEDYNEESMHYDWINDISRPRSYWEDLRKRRELEITNDDSGKDNIRNLIKRRTVSSFLASDFRENIDKILISRAPKKLEVERNLVEEEDSDERLVECSERHQEKLEENETEKVDLETVTVSDDFSQHSAKSMIMTWSFEDNEVAATIFLNPKDHENISSETQMICDLREQIKELQREMLELQSLVKSCVDFQEIVKFETLSFSDSLKINCSVCFEMPVDSLLYRCGHMCTCLKCAHELQWSSKKCPICMAPIVDVVKAFLDSSGSRN